MNAGADQCYPDEKACLPFRIPLDDKLNAGGTEKNQADDNYNRSESFEDPSKRNLAVRAPHLSA